MKLGRSLGDVPRKKKLELFRSVRPFSHLCFGLFVHFHFCVSKCYQVFITSFFFLFGERRYLWTLLILLYHCEYIPCKFHHQHPFHLLVTWSILNFRSEPVFRTSDNALEIVKNVILVCGTILWYDIKWFGSRH
jgi:hypothetical protein